MKKSLNYLPLLLLAVTSLLLIKSPLAASAANTGNISTNISHYNGIIFGDHTIYQADIEGSTAVQKNIYMNGGFSYAAAGEGHTNVLIGKPYLAPNTPGLLLGGQLVQKDEGHLVISGGDLVHQPNSFDSIDSLSFHNGKLREISTDEMSRIFSSFQQQVTHNIDLYQELISEGNAIGQLTNSNVTLFQSKKNEKVLFVTLNGDNLPNLQFKDAYLPNLDNYERIIFYSLVETLTFSQGALLYDNQIINTNAPQSQLIDYLAQKMTWLLPNATNVNINAYGLIGDVYAPNATVVGRGGAINGSLYTKNLIQDAGFELHNFNNQPLSTLPLTPIEPSTPTEDVKDPDKPDEKPDEEIPLTPIEPSEPTEKPDEEIPVTPIEPS